MIFWIFKVNCDVTDIYPEKAKFRLTCEASCPVDEYLKYASLAAAGRIEETG